MCARDLPDIYAQGWGHSYIYIYIYIYKANQWAPMLQAIILCVTSGILKIGHSYSSLLSVFINVILGIVTVFTGFFEISMTFIYAMHCSSCDCGFRI